MPESDHQDITLLQEIYQNAAMGERGTRMLLEKSADNKLNAKLSQFAEGYQEIRDDATALLESHGEAPKDAGTMEQAAQWMGVQLNTLIDKSPSHMAEMLIQGSAMGIVKGIKGIKRGYETESRSRELAGRLVKLEQDNLNAMKTFLS